MEEYTKRLIEGKFPCQEVGAETRRERDTGQAPPTHRLHVWWARRPLTPSRAALLGGLLPEDTDSNDFLRNLGIVKKQVIVGNQRWNLVGKNLELIESDGTDEFIANTEKFQKALAKENDRRKNVRNALIKLYEADSSYRDNIVIKNWLADNQAIDLPLTMQSFFQVVTVVAHPSEVNDRISLKNSEYVKTLFSSKFSIDPEDMYCYGRAYENINTEIFSNITILDPTSGGGSIPFEAQRLGCNVIANDLNPVATAIEKATMEYPAKYGKELLVDIEHYGTKLVGSVSDFMKEYFPQQNEEKILDYLYCRTVICPHCGKRVPLLNSMYILKQKDGWMVVPKIEEVDGNPKIRLIPTQISNGKGPNGENPDMGTVKRGTGTCILCGQAIESDEIKKQARGESEFGIWEDKLYCVVATKEKVKVDKDGAPLVYLTGKNKGKPKTEKITFFREPTQEDFAALEKSKMTLEKYWNHWEELEIVPNESIPVGHKTIELLNLGIDRWYDMFTPRQLLSHLVTMEKLHDMIPCIIDAHGREKGSAIIHYLQYMIDKGVDYNSRQTRWEYTRGIVKGTFGRHDFSLKWTFGEMVYAGTNSGLNWGKNQVIGAYKGICSLLGNKCNGNVAILNGSAANMDIKKDSVDIICIDPPYYNNVQYAELSDYFYVWQKRTFSKLYPELFSRRLTNKMDEAVANPVRDGGTKEASRNYEKLMSEIFAECRRVLKDDGLMIMMFTHKTQEAWETLTRALIENGWIISSSFPVDSESAASLHQKDMAAAASSIFLACRKRSLEEREPSVWNGFGGTGVQQQLRHAVKESLKSYKALKLNAVDEMVASYGSALKVLSENWPVIDGDNLVSPMDAMREASTIVAQYQMTKLTNGQLNVEDVAPEAGIALTLFGIYGNGSIPYDDALSLSKSLGIRLENKAAGYRNEGRMIGINTERTTRQQEEQEDNGYYAPLVKKGSKLRLVLPEERNALRLEKPQNEWDVLHGLIMAYRDGDIPVARAYLQKNASEGEEKIIGILKVWADGCGNEKLEKEAQRILYSLK